MTSDVILETEGLTKEFRGFVAVRNVGLRVRRGSIHALIGPNGAGKTTCFNLLTHFLTPTAGRIRFNGRDITGSKPAADRVAVQDGDGDLRHVLQQVQGADPVAVERLVDGAGRERAAVHPRTEGAARAAHHDDERRGVARRALHALREGRGERGVERVEHGRPVESDPAHAVPRLVDHGSGRATI